MIAPVANALWLAASAADHRRFAGALVNVRDAQERLLARCLQRNADTVYGRKHGFAVIRSAQEYRERVPLITYDDLVPLMERVAAGESRVLTQEPVRVLEPTGGSTRAAKWIPYTASLQAEFRRAVAAWIWDLLTTRPTLACGRAYWSISPSRPTGSPCTAVPVGFAEDAEYLGGPLRRLVSATLAVPSDLRLIPDIEQHRRLTLLFLLRCRDLCLVSVWHPSYFVLLLDSLKEQWHSLLRDLAKGVRLRAPALELQPSPRRARELDAIGPTDLRRIWPRLQLVSCWGDAHAARSLEEISALFPGVEVQPKGLLATEAFVSLPYRGLRPLAVTSHFVEFLDSHDTPCFAWEVEPRKTYSVVVTTGGGLYRYRLRDLIEVTGFLGETPCLKFLGKEDNISDRFGEKLEERFVASVLERILGGAGVRAPFALLAPENENRTTRYVLYLASDLPAPGHLADELERALEDNPCYEACVRIGQLAPARVQVVDRGAFGRYVRQLQRSGQRPGDVKPRALDPRSGWGQILSQAESARASGST